MCATHVQHGVCLLCASVPIVCLVPVSVLCQGLAHSFNDELNPGSSLQRVHRQYNKRYARRWEPIDLHVDDVTVLLALQEKECWAKWHDNC